MYLKNWAYKYPIPRSYRNRIAALFYLVMINPNYYGIVDLVLGTLTATEISLVAHWLGITNSFIYAEKYLNPLRDIDPTMATFGPLVSLGHTMLILGDDVKVLMDRIQNPSEYWVKRVAEIENLAIAPTMPEVCIVALPPDICERSDHLERRGWTSGSDATDTQLMQLFNFEILAQPKRLFMEMNIKMGTNLTLDTDIESYTAIMRMMMNVNVKSLQPSVSGTSKRMCTMHGMFISIDWVDVYANASSMRSLCYINASKNPPKIELSPRQAGSAMWSMTPRGTIVLWEKGARKDGMGMAEFLDSYSKFSFRVPHK
jgi:hypothetical protein